MLHNLTGFLLQVILSEVFKPGSITNEKVDPNSQSEQGTPSVQLKSSQIPEIPVVPVTDEETSQAQHTSSLMEEHGMTEIIGETDDELVSLPQRGVWQSDCM